MTGLLHQAIAEVFDALTSQQPYRAEMTPYEAMQHMLGDMQGRLDGRLIRSFIPKLLGSRSADGPFDARF